MVYLAYQNHTSKWPCQAIILVTWAILDQKKEDKVYVNLDKSLTDLQTLIKYSFVLNFLINL